MLSSICSLIVVTCFAELSGGYNTGPSNISISKGLLEPSHLYSYNIGLLLFIPLISILFLNIYYTRTEGIKMSSFLWERWVLPVISAVFLFVIYPTVYREFLCVYLNIGHRWSDFSMLTLLPLLCYSKVWGQLLLISIWFMVQPITLYIFRRNKTKKGLFPRYLLILFAFLSIWFVFSLFEPLVQIRL